MKIDPARFLFLAQALSAAAVAAGSAGACSSGTVGSDSSSSGTSGNASGSSATSTSSGTPGTSGRPADSDAGAPSIPEQDASTPAPAPPAPPPKQDAGPSTTVQCPGESLEPNESPAYLRLSGRTDCDGPLYFDSAKSGTLDSDSFSFFGSDTLGLCEVAPKFWINNPSLQLYVQMYCPTGATAIRDCGANGSLIEGKYCVTTPGSPSYMVISSDCPGEDDSAWVYMDVYPAGEGTTNECRSYRVYYEF